MNQEMQLSRAKKIAGELHPSWWRNFEFEEILSEAFIIVAANSDNKSSHEVLKLKTIGKLREMYSKNRLCGMTFYVQGQRGAQDKSEIARDDIDVADDGTATHEDLVGSLTSTLNLIDRQIVIDTTIGGLTYKQVAKKLGMGVSTVSDHRKKAMKVVREVAEGMGLKAPA